MMPSVDYSKATGHPDYPDGTLAIIGIRDGVFGIAPGFDNSHTRISLVHHGEGVGVHLTRDELDEIIANLQRARSGCFFGRFPREGAVAPVQLVHPYWTVGELLDLLGDYPEDANVTIAPFVDVAL